MADSTVPAQGDSLWSLTRKILVRLNLGGGGGGGGGGAVTISDGSGSGGAAVTGANALKTDSSATTQPISSADGAQVSVGAKADAQATSAVGSWSLVALLKGLFNKANSIDANVALIQLGPTTVTGTVNAVASGNVGGFTQVLAEHVAVTAAAYSAGNVVGGLQTLTGALKTSNGTGILESLIILDRAAQKAPMNVYILSATPAGTYTDHAALSWGTGDDLIVLAVIPVATTDYQNTDNNKSFAVKSGLGIALKGTDGSNKLFAVAVTSGTPTYAATTDVQFTFGILQD